MIFAVPPTVIWETSNYLWNSDGQGTLTAWTYIITSYYPIQLWRSRYSALDKLGIGVGVIFALPPHCYMGDKQLSLEQRRPGDSNGVDLYYYFLLSYPIMVEPVLGA